MKKKSNNPYDLDGFTELRDLLPLISICGVAGIVMEMWRKIKRQIIVEKYLLKRFRIVIFSGAIINSLLLIFGFPLIPTITLSSMITFFLIALICDIYIKYEVEKIE